MDPATVTLIGDLLLNTPPAIAYFQRTYARYKAGTIPLEEVIKDWQDVVGMVGHAEGRWIAAGQASQTVQPS